MKLLGAVILVVLILTAITGLNFVRVRLNELGQSHRMTQ